LLAATNRRLRRVLTHTDASQISVIWNHSRERIDPQIALSVVPRLQIVHASRNGKLKHSGALSTDVRSTGNGQKRNKNTNHLGYAKEKLCPPTTLHKDHKCCAKHLMLVLRGCEHLALARDWYRAYQLPLPAGGILQINRVSASRANTIISYSNIRMMNS
jgi:hypothetical protein